LFAQPLSRSAPRVNTYQSNFPLPIKNAAVAKSDLLKVLEKSFTEEEWLYLKNHPAFDDRMKTKDWVHEPLENLIEWGILLLKQKQELHLAKPHQISHPNPVL
jgi:hypothetical protein